MPDATEGLPRDVVCPACFKPVPSERTECGACGAGVWVDDKLVLVGALQEGQTAVFRGLLRGDNGRLEDVAVKVLDVGGLPNWREYERFRRQTDILGSLKHPRIPRARGDFEVKGRVLHCQTRVAGRNLARQLRGARLSNDEATRLAEELLEILDYLHDRDVVHRDVKPDNVIIDERGAAHLVDFGGARRLRGASAGGDAAKLEAEPTVVGTPGYMAPEQARGELVSQSDLYGLGKLLLEALAGAKPAGALAVLLPQLVREDWRKRPASAAAALRVLRPALAARRNRWPFVAVASLALVGVVAAVRHQSGPPAARAVAAEAPAAASEGPSLEEQARALLAEWLDAQNARDVDRYGRLYASEFHGIRRTPTGKQVDLDRAAWLAERARMYAKPVEVRADDVTVEADAQSGRATVAFTQRFRRGPYAEHGHKRLVGKRSGTTMQWVSEEMVYSRPGWDEESLATQVPLAAADCRIAFDPGAGKNLVVLSKHDEYVTAIQAAAASRKKKIPVEIVWGLDFDGLEGGYWVLAGATDDADKAAALASKLGGEVRESQLNEHSNYGVSRLLARKRLHDIACYDHRHFTVVDGTAYVVGQGSVITFPLLGSDLTEKSRVALPAGIRTVRLAAHQGAPHLLDVEGHWHRIGPESIDRAPSFDPDSDEGKVAVFPSIRFNVEGSNRLTARATNADPVAWPEDIGTTTVYRASDDRLIVIRAMELFVFSVGTPPHRLTKLCATVRPDAEGEKLNAPAAIVVGPMHLITDRSGRLDIWTGAWGFIQPDIGDVMGGKSVLQCGDSEEEFLEIPMVPLFRQTSTSVQGSAGCGEVGC